MSYDYKDKLDVRARRRYDEKLAVAGPDVECPYRLPASQWENDPTKWPNVTYPDIYCYLVMTPGVFTNEMMKNFRSLEGWKMLQAGWVQTVYHLQLANGSYFLKTKVMPSMRVNDPPHNPWVVVDNKGVVLLGHCDCKAGLGESCMHVAALLFKVECATRLGYSRQAVCTDLPCKWNNDFVSKVQPQTIRSIKFYQTSVTEKAQLTPNRRKKFAPSTSQERSSFENALAMCTVKPVVLSTFNRFAAIFKSSPVAPATTLPTDMRSFYTPTNRDLSPSQLSDKCTDILSNLSVTQEQIDYLCKVTGAQAKNPVWWSMRAGRVGSSEAHDVAHTNKDHPAPSVIKRITSGKPQCGQTPAMKWGTDHEADALMEYQKEMAPKHKNFKIQKCGMFLHKDFPYFSASPDSLASCDCCGVKCVEVKCPAKHKDSSLEDMAADTGFCLARDNKIKTNHRYYTQVQWQMFVLGINDCDFVVWTPTYTIIVPVKRDPVLEVNLVRDINMVYRQHILPELCTRNLECMPQTSVSTSTPPMATLVARDSEPLFCYCQSPDDGSETMVGCDSSDCRYQWFHLSCLKRKRPPTQDVWYCKDCKKGMKENVPTRKRRKTIK